MARRVNQRISALVPTRETTVEMPTASSSVITRWSHRTGRPARRGTTSRSSKGTTRSAKTWPCSCPLPATSTMSSGPAEPTASVMAARRSDSTVGIDAQPATICEMISSGSSERGLSEVTTTASAVRQATSPIIGRFPLSRSPPHPNTTVSRPRGSRRVRAVASACSSASGVWAKSTTTTGAPSPPNVSKRPGTGGRAERPSAIWSSGTPRARQASAASRAFITLWSPGIGSSMRRSRQVNALPVASSRRRARHARRPVAARRHRRR